MKKGNEITELEFRRQHKLCLELSCDRKAFSDGYCGFHTQPTESKRKRPPNPRHVVNQEKTLEHRKSQEQRKAEIEDWQKERRKIRKRIEKMKKVSGGSNGA